MLRVCVCIIALLGGLRRDVSHLHLFVVFLAESSHFHLLLTLVVLPCAVFR